MVELLLNIIYACRAGKWELLLECIRDVVAYAFAYDNFNYARYLTPFLGEMLNLEVDHPEIYHAFVQGNFSVQLNEDNTFGRMEADKVIETTINKDTKTPGGTTGFSTNSNAIKMGVECIIQSENCIVAFIGTYVMVTSNTSTMISVSVESK